MRSKNFIKFYAKNRGKIIFISVLILLILFAMPFIATRKTKIGSEYIEKEDVALYIMQHHELPPNYITHYGYEYYRKHNIEATGLLIGGDTHYYDLSLKNFGIEKTQPLKECDIYVESYSLTNRNTCRLVYTCNSDSVRVFYTTDHYDSYTELTYFSLQLTRYIFWIIFGVYSVLFVCFYITVCVLNKKSKNKEVLLLEKSE